MRSLANLFILSGFLLEHHAQAVIIKNNSNEEACITLRSGACHRNEPFIILKGRESMRQPYGSKGLLAPGQSDIFMISAKEKETIERHFLDYPKGKIVMRLFVSYPKGKRDFCEEPWWGSAEEALWSCDAFAILAHTPFDPHCIKDIVIIASSNKGMIKLSDTEMSKLKPDPNPFGEEGTYEELCAMREVQACSEK